MSRAGRRGVAVVFAAILGLALQLGMFATPASAATVPVSTAADNGNDMAPTAGSLRAAIIMANASPGADTIEFAIGAPGSLQTITPPSALPAITEQLLINGKSQGGAGYTGAPLIELDGVNTSGVYGLTFDATDVEVRGLVINGFGAGGIFIGQARGKVTGSYIGIDANGLTPAGSGGDGITVDGADSTIGGIGAGEGNVISANGSNGVFVCSCATGVSIMGNYIGTDKDGAMAIGNNTGVLVLNASGATIGGATAAHRNVISGNISTGVTIQGATATGARIIGNYIGADATGTGTRGNGIGIEIVSAPGVSVGGSAAGEGNVISGNTTAGVRVSNADSTGTSVIGNLIGTDKNGAFPVANGDGVILMDSVGVTVGGAASGARNVISGNISTGVSILGSSTTGAVVAGNYIGTNQNGSGALPNFKGILVQQASGVTIGGTGAGAGNVISGNILEGVIVHQASTAGLLIAGNLIGTDKLGVAALGNMTGIVLVDTVGVTVGGTSVGARNVISGHVMGGGVTIQISSSSGNTIAGNYLGVNATGSAALPNLYGVAVQAGSGTTVGGTATGAGNLISGNTESGVQVTNTGQAAIFGNAITGNGALGIDLGAAGVTLNDAGDGDSGANGLQNFPVIRSATTLGSESRVVVTLNSRASQAYVVELFSNPSCDTSGYGEGVTFLGRFPVNTDAEGNATLAATVPTLTVGHMVTATATSAGGLTSEFSLCRSVSTPAITVTPSGGGTATVEGGATDTFTVVLTSQPADTVTIALASNATGLASFSPSAALAFTTGNWNTPQTVTVASVDNQVYHATSYTIEFTVSSADELYARLVLPSLPATHTDNDPQPALSVADAAVAERATGTVPATFQITLSAVMGQVVTVQYATSDGTAVAGQDYQATSGTLTFQPGETVKSVIVQVRGDVAPESAETFTLTLSSPTGGALLGTAQATGTILDVGVLPPCSPRPAVQVQTAVSGGQLRVTITTTPLNTQAANVVREVRFGAFQNARVTVGSQTVVAGQTVTAAANSSTFEFVVARATAGQPTTVPITVVDSCGEWTTLVGGGAGAGF